MSRVISWVAVLSLWSCTPIEPEKGYGYLCSRETGPADQCPGDFHCGLEGRCLKNQPGTYQCESDIDCYGWHCGVAKRCYDLADAGAESCRDDSDCNGAAGWRCDPDSKCVDASLDAVQPVGQVTVPFQQRTTELWAGAPSSVERRRSLEGSLDGGCGSTLYALYSDDSLVELEFEGGDSLRCMGFKGARRTPMRQPHGVAFASAGLLTLGQDGLVESWAGAVSTVVASGATALRTDGVTASAVTREGFVVFSTDGGIRTSTLWPDAGVMDVAIASGEGPRFVVVLVDGGATYRADYEPQSGALSNLEAKSLGLFSCAPRPEVQRVALSTVDYGEGLLAMFESNGWRGAETFRTTGSLPSGCQMVGSDGGLMESNRTAGLTGCVTFPLVAPQLDGGLFGACRSGDGRLLTNSSESSDVAASATASAEANLDAPVFAGRFPSLWGPTVFSEPATAPVLLDRAPDSMLQLGNRVLAFTGFRTPAGYHSGAAVLSDGVAPLYALGEFSTPVPVRGLVDAVAVSTPFRSVVLRLSETDGFVVLARLSTGGTVTAAAVAEQPDGGALLLVGDGDVLRRAEPATDGGEAVPIPVVVPAPSLSITAIAPVHGALGAGYVGGHVIAGGRVFRFVAENPVVFRTSEIIVGDSAAVDVWDQRGRVRVGFADGTVVALPSRTQVAPPAGTEISSYRQVCDRLFAVADDGLLQLVVSEGERRGKWALIHEKRGGGKAFFASGKLTVAWSDGSYGELPVPDCAD